MKRRIPKPENIVPPADLLPPRIIGSPLVTEDELVEVLVVDTLSKAWDRPADRELRTGYWIRDLG
jgi:hypothetical protein